VPKKVKIELDFDIGDIVYLKTDPEEPVKRMVIAITLLPGGVALYTLSCGDSESTEHYAIEIQEAKPVE
jgi:hypothetical protein